VLLERGMAAVRLQPLNCLLGAALGVVKAGLILGAVCLGLASYPHPATKEVMDRSTLAPALAEAVQLVTVAVPQEYKDWLSSGLQSLRDLARVEAEGIAARPGGGNP